MAYNQIKLGGKRDGVTAIKVQKRCIWGLTSVQKWCTLIGRLKGNGKGGRYREKGEWEVEAWQITRREYDKIGDKKFDFPVVCGVVYPFHSNYQLLAIHDALRNGKVVPQKVLDSFPRNERFFQEAVELHKQARRNEKCHE